MHAKGLHCSWQMLAHQFFPKTAGYRWMGPAVGVDAYPAAVSASWNKPMCLCLGWRTWLQIIKSLLYLCWLKALESKAGYLGCSFAYHWGNARLSWVLHLQRDFLWIPWSHGLTQVHPEIVLSYQQESSTFPWPEHAFQLYPDSLNPSITLFSLSPSDAQPCTPARSNYKYWEFQWDWNYIWKGLA